MTYEAHFMKSTISCMREEEREERNYNRLQSMLNMEKYKKEHNAYGYTALWGQSSHA